MQHYIKWVSTQNHIVMDDINKIDSELDLSYYATEFDTMCFCQLLTSWRLPTDLSKLAELVDKDIVKENIYDELGKIVNAIVPDKLV